MYKKVVLGTALAVAMFVASPALARDQLRVVGSSTVFPFTTAVAENFGNTTRYPTPVVESTGTGGGFKLFCAGVGTDHPDFTNASRPIKSTEEELCAANGVTPVEMMVGYDGIVLASSKNSVDFNVSTEQLFLALAKQVPDANGNLVDNPYTNWSQIDSNLPNMEIEVLGPPPTSGTRDAFVELVMEEGAESLGLKEGRTKDEFKAVAHTMREDGLFVEAGENDNLIVQKLDVNPEALGIFGFSFLDQNADKIKGSNIDGVEPTFENIASGEYPVSRSLFVYAKQEHLDVIPGARTFVEKYLSDEAASKTGYLVQKGLIPLSVKELEEIRRRFD